MPKYRAVLPARGTPGIVPVSLEEDPSDLGKAEVKEFVEAFDIPGIDFVPTELSKGDDACCFTWLVRVNGNDGPKGISFYGSDSQGKIDYIRDIPATTPAPLQQLAALVNPALRKF